MKKILCISLVLVMMLSFAACSTNTDTNDTVSADNATPSTTEPETTTLEAPEGFALFQDKEVAVGYPSDWTKTNDTTFTNGTATITVETQDKTDYYSTLDTSKYVQKAKDELQTEAKKLVTASVGKKDKDGLSVTYINRTFTVEETGNEMYENIYSFNTKNKTYIITITQPNGMEVDKTLGDKIYETIVVK